MTDKAPRVLVVDDEPEHLYYLASTLMSAGYRVTRADAAARAAALLERESFAVVVSDLLLPDGSGLNVLAEARRRQPLSLGIVVTGHGSVASALTALREGAFDYLLKPCLAEQLCTAVRRAADHHALRAALLEKTREAEKLKEQLDAEARVLQDVSHELKSPLSVLHGYATMLVEGRLPPEQREKGIALIHQNAESLRALVDDLLESVRVGGGRVVLEPETIQARQLCDGVADCFAHLARRRGVSLTVRSDGEPAATGDRRRVLQILNNLIANALKFTSAGGSIELSVIEEPAAARFTVSDTGCGIKPEDLPRLFRRFYRAEETRASHAGLGLGLDICRSLVELQGGRIWAESEPGRGTKIHFTLPCANV